MFVFDYFIAIGIYECVMSRALWGIKENKAHVIDFNQFKIILQLDGGQINILRQGIYLNKIQFIEFTIREKFNLKIG